MKTIVGIFLFLVVFSAAKSFVGTINGTASALEKHNQKVEIFYAENKIKY